MNFLIAQLSTFMVMLVFGFFLGLVFHIYQIVINRLKLKKMWIKIGDLSLGFVAGLGGFFLLLHTNWGYLRFYVFFAILLGFIIYYYILRPNCVRK